MNYNKNKMDKKPKGFGRFFKKRTPPPPPCEEIIARTYKIPIQDIKAALPYTISKDGKAVEGNVVPVFANGEHTVEVILG